METEFTNLNNRFNVNNDKIIENVEFFVDWINFFTFKLKDIQFNLNFYGQT